MQRIFNLFHQQNTHLEQVDQAENGYSFLIHTDMYLHFEAKHSICTFCPQHLNEL